jgi:uncharacterized protein YecE (DUF72 family)
MAAKIYVGCAGWSIPKPYADHFPAAGTHLARYAARLACVEINSSFYRPHRRATYERWRDATPAHFRFAVKAPKAMTHEQRLQDCGTLLTPFLEQIEGLGEKLAACLVQLPPSLSFEPAVAEVFFAELRNRFAGAVVCEPRHASWFESPAAAMLRAYSISQVAADPAILPQAARPGGWPEMAYYRLHGSPRVYYSSYDAAYLDDLASRLRSAAETASTWCIFDNTAAGAATDNAFALSSRLGDGD